jgi:hypothetical protein
MSWLDDQRRDRIAQERKPHSRTTRAIKALTGQGWTSKNFSDVAYALGKEEQGGGRQLQKLITKSTFAEPSSATSGVQAYDLEGADGKKKLKRTSMLSPGKGSFRGMSGKVYRTSHKGEEIDVLLSDARGLAEQGFTIFE